MRKLGPVVGRSAGLEQPTRRCARSRTRSAIRWSEPVDEHGAVAARRGRAPARAPRAGRAIGSTGGVARAVAGERGERGRAGSERGCAARVDDRVRRAGGARPRMPAASLSSSIADDRHERPIADDLGQRLGQRGRAGRVVGAVVDHERVRSTTSRRPGTSTVAAGAPHRVRVERGRGTPRRPRAATREVAPLEGPWPRELGTAPASAPRRTAGRARSAATRSATRLGLGRQRRRSRAAVVADHRELLARRCRAIVGPSQRVCSSATLVSTCTRDGITLVAS